MKISTSALEKHEKNQPKPEIFEKSLQNEKSNKDEISKILKQIKWYMIKFIFFSNFYKNCIFFKSIKISDLLTIFNQI